MHFSKLVAVLPVFALAGCWPYLGGPYEDYLDGEGTDGPDGDSDTLSDRGTDDPGTDEPDDPDTDEIGDGGTLFGVFTNVQFMGGYWGGGQANDSAAQRTIVGAASPGFDWDFTSAWPAVGQCSNGSTLIDDLDDNAVDVGLPSSFGMSVGGRSVPLEVWEENANLRAGSNANPAAPPSNANVSLTTSTDDGGISGTISRTPSDFSWDEPLVDGDQMIELPRTPFNVTWTGTGQDTVIGTFLFQDDNFEVLGGGICNVPSTGFGVDPADAPSGTAFIELRLERIREYDNLVPGSAGVWSNVAGTLEKRGYVALELEAE